MYMDEIEYRINDNVRENRVGISVKRPEGINRKWSESDVWIQCSECESTELRTDKSGDLLTIVCLDCPNYWQGFVGRVVGYRNSEEAYASVYNVEQFEEVPREERDNIV